MVEGYGLKIMVLTGRKELCFTLLFHQTNKLNLDDILYAYSIKT